MWSGSDAGKAAALEVILTAALEVILTAEPMSVGSPDDVTRELDDLRASRFPTA